LTSEPIGTRAAGRPNQRQRTRKDLLQAASRLMRDGRHPTLEEVAEAALVSRATAYRHFPGVEPLLVEAALDLAFPDGESLLAGVASDDPVARLECVESGVAGMIRENEGALRAMLAHSVQRDSRAEGASVRQNRRTPLIEAALAPARSRFEPEAYAMLVKALALVIGTESMVVFSDVLELDAAEADRVKKWVMRAMVGAALARISPQS
jgi:AcrR family transcriptional regulator